MDVMKISDSEPRLHDDNAEFKNIAWVRCYPSWCLTAV